MILERHPRISIDSKVCHGKPVVAGTRILVSQLLAALASGSSYDELLEDYPSLKVGAIHAAVFFSKQIIMHRVK